jgi:hypothetical protein
VPAELTSLIFCVTGLAMWSSKTRSEVARPYSLKAGSQDGEKPTG